MHTSPLEKLLTSLKIPHTIKGDKHYIADKEGAMRAKAVLAMKGGAKTKKTKPKTKAKKPKTKKK
jgi:hypothetical protein